MNLRTERGRTCRIESLEEREMLDAGLMSALDDIFTLNVSTPENDTVIVDANTEENQSQHTLAQSPVPAAEDVSILPTPAAAPPASPASSGKTATTVNLVWDAGEATIVQYKVTHDRKKAINEKKQVWVTADIDFAEGGNEATAKGLIAGYTTYVYDSLGSLLTKTDYDKNNAVLSKFVYTYNDKGLVGTMETLDGKWSYGYDAIGQLFTANFVSANTQIANQSYLYLYDAAGNRIETVTNGTSVEYVVNAMNQYTRIGDFTYQYDADGNMIEKQNTVRECCKCCGKLGSGYSEKHRKLDERSMECDES